MTWFFCLRYYTTLADKYPELTTQGILWFKDIFESRPELDELLIFSIITFFSANNILSDFLLIRITSP